MSLFLRLVSIISTTCEENSAIEPLNVRSRIDEKMNDYSLLSLSLAAAEEQPAYAKLTTLPPLYYLPLSCRYSLLFTRSLNDVRREQLTLEREREGSSPPPY